ncbi:MAG TPA: TadE/TadG family type IV pilus assembly protein [Actinomycetota bacterium]|nr:TadE/TadG family type IV pilus assembly protein [Actinomycetota bacterium]
MEFALLLPILFLVLLATVQVGMLAKDQLLLTQAARAGAREATVTLDEARVREVALGASLGLDPARFELGVDREGSQGSVVTVSVGYRAVVASPLAGWLLPVTVDLSASASMRQEVA